MYKKNKRVQTGTKNYIFLLLTYTRIKLALMLHPKAALLSLNTAFIDLHSSPELLELNFISNNILRFISRSDFSYSSQIYVGEQRATLQLRVL